MKKIKINSLLIVCFLLAFVLFVPAVFAKAQDNPQNNNEINGEQHKSDVAKFVKNLLETADKTSSEIGKQIKEIAKEQEDSKNDVADKIDRIRNRSSWKTFFIGTDWKNVGQLRSAIVKVNNQIEKLNKLMEKATSSDNKAKILEQINALEDQQKKINDFIKANESKFSLFGWFTRLFNQ